ncbi:MAG: carbohydrate kinase family protein [Tranquillimonas sp.]
MILCCGDALIDMLPRQTEAGEAAFAPYAGGAVLNTAVALGRLGTPAGFFQGLSTDLFGEMLIAALHDSGVDTGYAARSDRPTTLAFVRLVDGQATYAFYDENTASRMLDIADLPDLDDSVSALFFGGISLVVEPCGSAFEALAMREAPRRAVMLDPNIRPGFIRDEAAYRARIGRMIALADIVKLSDDDLHWLEGPGPAADLAAVLLDRGPKLVCITEGAQGATGFSRAGTVSVPAQKVQVVDTVGAGDTFNAGLLAGLDGAGTLTKEGLAALPLESLRAALDLGVRAAAVTVARAGANPPRRDEL